MSRALLTMGLVCFGSVFAADADEDADRYRAYFANLDLPYGEPRSCGDNGSCVVTGDFNGDGMTDMAALYVYAGDKTRRNNRNADLAILYSRGESGEPAHTVFVLVGQVDPETGSTSASLGVQEAGPLKTPAGEITLDRPGINVYFGPDRGPSQFLTFRWRNGYFEGVDKSDD